MFSIELQSMWTQIETLPHNEHVNIWNQKYYYNSIRVLYKLLKIEMNSANSEHGEYIQFIQIHDITCWKQVSIHSSPVVCYWRSTQTDNNRIQLWFLVYCITLTDYSSYVCDFPLIWVFAHFTRCFLYRSLYVSLKWGVVNGQKKNRHQVRLLDYGQRKYILLLKIIRLDTVQPDKNYSY